MSDDDLRALYAFFMHGVAPGTGAAASSRHRVAVVDALADGTVAQGLRAAARRGGP
jgi:hypothetical protein